MTELDKARFWIKVSQTKYCWEWTGAVNDFGYGMFRFKGTPKLAHRISYGLIYGEFDNKSQVLHICDNPKCVNPSHLVLGTHSDNMKDKSLKGRGRFQGRTSKYLGVGYRNDSGSWRAYVCINGKNKYIGSYKTELEAVEARDKYILDNKLDALTTSSNK